MTAHNAPHDQVSEPALIADTVRCHLCSVVFPVGQWHYCSTPPQVAEDVAGCWITAGWDMNWYDVRPHASEIDALRYCAIDPHMGRSTFFVPWGEELHDKHHISKQRQSDGQADA